MDGHTLGPNQTARRKVKKPPRMLSTNESGNNRVDRATPSRKISSKIQIKDTSTLGCELA